MKKTKIFLTVILIILFFGGAKAYAESDIKDELLDEVIAEVESESVDFEQITKNVQDGSAFDFLGVVNSVLKLFTGEFKESMFLVIKLIALAVLAGVLCNLKTTEEGGATEVSFFACYASVAGLLINSFYELTALADSTVDTLKIFMQSLFPAMSAVVAASGAASLASMSPVLFGAMQIITMLIQSAFLPLIFTVTALCIVNNLSKIFHIHKLIELLRLILKWSLGLLMTVFVGLLGLQGISSAFFDGIAGKTVKYALCNFVPVVGGVLADSASSVVFSVGVVKNTVGIAGIISLCTICAVPLVKITAIGIMLRLSAGICEPATDKRLVGLFSDVAGSVTQVFGILLMVCVMFIISIAILCILSGNAAMAL